MDTSQATKLFRNNWFLRNEEKPALTGGEERFMAAAMGPQPERWRGAPDLREMRRILADEPGVLDRIGAHLLQVLVGMKGCGPAVAFLLDRGVPFEIDESSFNVLHEAAWGGMDDTLRAVFQAGAADATGVSVEKPHVGWPANLSLVYWTAWGGYPACTLLLIRYGAGVHHELPIKGNGERGTTSLQEAVSPSQWGPNPERLDGKREVARILIEDGARYDVCSACARDDTPRLKELLAEDPGAATAAAEYDMTPLHWAARAGSMACARILLAAGAPVNALNKARRSPLQLAAEHDHAGMIRLLAGHGADLDTQDPKGRTPLHRATYEGKVAAVEALLESGADPSVTNKSGRTAFEIARKEARHYKERA